MLIVRAVMGALLLFSWIGGWLFTSWVAQKGKKSHHSLYSSDISVYLIVRKTIDEAKSHINDRKRKFTRMAIFFASFTRSHWQNETMYISCSIFTALQRCWTSIFTIFSLYTSWLLAETWDPSRTWYQCLTLASSTQSVYRSSKMLS